MAAVLGKERKGIWLLCQKEEEFPNKKHGTERIAALTLFRPNNGETNGMILF